MRLRSFIPRYFSSQKSAFILDNDLYAAKVNDFLCPNHIPLAVLHGMLGSKMNWRSIANNIARSGHDVITVDLRNHGDSPHSREMNYDLMSDDLLRTLRHVFPTSASFVLMGHSMGGKVAMVAALKQPKYVSRLIVVDILPSRIESAGAAFVKNILKVLEIVELDPYASSLSDARTHVLKQLTAHISDSNIRHWLTTNLGWNSTRGAFWRCNIEALSASVEDIVRFPVLENMTFTQPVLFIQGQNSRHMEVPNRDQIIKKLFPNAETVVIKGAGHWVHAEKPIEFLRVVKNFLAG